MAITINSVSRGHGQTQAPRRVIVVNVDLDNSYPAGGYDIDASMDAEGTPTIEHSPFQPISNGTTLRYARIVNDGGTLKLRVFTDATLAQAAGATDLSTYTGIEVFAITQ